MLNPLPILRDPWVRRGLVEFMIDLQIQEECFLGLWLEKSSFGQYLALSVLVRRRFGFLHILQYCLDSMALFMGPKFLIPNPHFFGLVMVSQFVMCSYFWFVLCLIA